MIFGDVNTATTMATVFTVAMMTNVAAAQESEDKMVDVLQQVLDNQEALVAELESVKSEVGALRSEVKALRMSEATRKTHVEAGSVTIGEAQGTRDRSSCHSGMRGRRGVVRGRVEFASAFVRPPAIIIALSEVDHIDNDNLRLRVGVGSVDTLGFYYEFYTWCRTDIVMAVARWMAVAQ